MPLNPALRDPMARRRLGGAQLAVLVLWPLLHAAQVHPGALLDPANLRVIGGFLAARAESDPHLALRLPGGLGG